MEVDNQRKWTFQKNIKQIRKLVINHASKQALVWRKQNRMQTEELARLAHRVKNSLPNVETLPLATIYNIIEEREKASLNLADFKELIYYLTGWDISFQVISRQLEINRIML